MQSFELSIDVTEAVQLGIQAHTAANVYLPDAPVVERPIVCFAFPGGGYNRRYYALNLDDEVGGQATFHTRRGWIFVACDHIGVGDSTVPEGNVLTYENVARANQAAVNTVMEKLEQGTLSPSIAPVTDAVKLGIGQSMGGCFTIILQGQHAPFDGIALLGYSAAHTTVPPAPGKPPLPWPWIVRGSDPDQPIVVNKAAMARATRDFDEGKSLVAGGKEEDHTVDWTSLVHRLQQNLAAAGKEHPYRWAFHYDDVPADLVVTDLNAKNADGSLPYWRSQTAPLCAVQMVTPGTVAPEAAAITVPVMVASGERDVVPQPKNEPLAFHSSSDVTVYICPRMGHMHNFASTRQLFWARLHQWGSGVAESHRLCGQLF